MAEKSLSLHKGYQYTLVEKKSKFIANVVPVTTVEEAIIEIEKIKKEYWDARHNCFAYVIGENGQEVRCSDDGEPSNTAGKPILDVIQGSGIKNILVVVTRYFGGTLLGTGGLVRAYSQTAKLGIEGCVVIEKQWGQYLEIRTDYNGIGKIQYILGQHNIHIVSSEYTDVVKVLTIINTDAIDNMIDLITQGTNGKGELNAREKLWYAMVEGGLMLFD